MSYQEEKKRLSVLIYCPQPVGGIAEHNHYQAKALSKCGAHVIVLTSPGYLRGREVEYPVERCLLENEMKSSSPLARKIVRSWHIIYNEWRFAWAVIQHGPSLILVACYAEYLSPFWIWPHLFLSRFGDGVYGANLHDPVRDYQIGPEWWHHFSVWLAYLPLRFGLVHQRLAEPSPVPAHVEVIEVPVGLYDLTATHTDFVKIREGWRVPPGKKVFFAFGFIRDNKNLDLVIRALPDHPLAFLVVMGTVQSTRDKPLKFYQELATDLGVGERVWFEEVFVPDEKLGSYFAAADFIALTYDASFHSQSGVLSLAARARRPVLASAGDSPLQDSVRKFDLGIFVEPDSVPALSQGMGTLLAADIPSPRWDAYEAYASWDVNAGMILDAADRLQ
jgi:glycosyltransferase involved in cell wall biosynthesis